MSLIFTVLRRGSINNGDFAELTEDEIDYVREEYVKDGIKIPILYDKNGVGYVAFPNVDENFDEIDGDAKRLFLRSKLRA